MIQSRGIERMRRRGSRSTGRALVLLALFVAPSLGLRPPVLSGADQGVTPVTVEAVAGDAIDGRGILSRLACLGCVGAIMLAGGASIGGLFVLTAIFPESVASCGIACVLAFR